MILELFRLDNGQRFAISRHPVSDQWGWILECMNEEFPRWWTVDVDTAEQENGDEIINYDGEPKAVLRFSVERPILARRVA